MKRRNVVLVSRDRAVRYIRKVRKVIVGCVIVDYVLCSAILWHSEHRARVAYERIILVQRETLREMTELAGKRSADYWSCETELADARRGSLPPLPGTDRLR